MRSPSGSRTIGDDEQPGAREHRSLHVPPGQALVVADAPAVRRHVAERLAEAAAAVPGALPRLLDAFARLVVVGPGDRVVPAPLDPTGPALGAP